MGENKKRDTVKKNDMEEIKTNKGGYNPLANEYSHYRFDNPMTYNPYGYSVYAPNPYPYGLSLFDNSLPNFYPQYNANINNDRLIIQPLNIDYLYDPVYRDRYINFDLDNDVINIILNFQKKKMEIEDKYKDIEGYCNMLVCMMREAKSLDDFKIKFIEVFQNIEMFADIIKEYISIQHNENCQIKEDDNDDLLYQFKYWDGIESELLKLKSSGKTDEEIKNMKFDDPFLSVAFKNKSLQDVLNEVIEYKTSVYDTYTRKFMKELKERNNKL